MAVHPLIKINPCIMIGKPVIKVTRITVEQIPEKLSVVESINEVIQSYRHLTKKKVHTALFFATEYIRG